MKRDKICETLKDVASLMIIVMLFAYPIATVLFVLTIINWKVYLLILVAPPEIGFTLDFIAGAIEKDLQIIDYLLSFFFKIIRYTWYIMIIIW